MMELPKDSFILASYINQQLRDNYPSLDELCKSMDIDKAGLTETLKAAGFEYDREQNRFW